MKNSRVSQTNKNPDQPLQPALDNPPITPKKEPKLQAKTLQAMKLVDAGLTPKEALQATNFKENISSAGIAQFKQKYKKHSLTEPTMVRSAQNQIKRILKVRAREEAHRKVTKDGEVVEYTDNIYPTDSNILAAAAMVYDRYEPVKRDDAGAQAPATYIDLSRYNILVQAGDPVDNSSCQPPNSLLITKDE